MGTGLNGKWIEVFTVGRHTDSQGRTKEYTESDLDAAVNKYDPSRHEAPVVVGHPKDNSPAFGWVEGLKRVGTTLFAKLKQVAPEFEEAVKEGRYKKRSISFYPDMTLRHIGFLGGMPPAVKGLADISFAEDKEAMIFEFGDYRVSTVGRIFQRMRDFFIDKFDLETADRIISPWEIEHLTAPPKDKTGSKAASVAFSEEEDMKTIEELQAQLKQKETELAQFAENDQAKQAEIDALKAKIAKIEAGSRRAEFNSFCEQLKAEGRLTPAMIAPVLSFMETLHSAGEYEFAEDDQTVKKPALDTFKEFLQSLPKQVEFSEVATKQKAGAGNIDMEDPQAIAKAAAEYKEQEEKAGRTISFAEAVKHVADGGTK